MAKTIYYTRRVYIGVDNNVKGMEEFLEEWKISYPEYSIYKVECSMEGITVELYNINKAIEIMVKY
jgi:hypothetical protein